MAVDLNFLHFLVTVVVLFLLIIPYAARYYKHRNRYDESFSKPWGLVGYVNKEGDYVSRVPSKQEGRD